MLFLIAIVALVLGGAFCLWLYEHLRKAKDQAVREARRQAGS